jgi:hypothetical protein
LINEKGCGAHSRRHAAREHQGTIAGVIPDISRNGRGESREIFSSRKIFRPTTRCGITVATVADHARPTIRSLSLVDPPYRNGGYYRAQDDDGRRRERTAPVVDHPP